MNTRLRWRSAARRQLRLLLLTTFVLVIGSAASCGSEFDAVSDIKTLRILTVAATEPYPAPGETFQLSLTFSDSSEQGPRPIQVTWIGGCVDPAGGSYLACYPQIAGNLAAPATGQPLPDGLLQQEEIDPSLSGTPDAVTFDVPVAADVLDTATVTPSGVRVSTVVTFFAVCAGELGLLSEEEASTALPLGCFDAEGNRLGAQDFVFGYTQQFVFSDDRPNLNPEADGLELDGNLLSDDGQDNVVPRCATPPEEGCGAGESDCVTVDLKVLVDDIAEIDPEARDDEGNVLREVLWVDYYAEGGSFDGERKLISDPLRGYQTEFETTWTPPQEAGDVRIWAVVHDNRGGIDIASGVVSVQ